ncbi:acyltransferase [Yoonia litorea]|uniref:Maltose O-acetyltransferase n=1 Tax=Yoonia litorea TaxID=1123755 RepID=A0A1I6LDW0_9RHOB|nr:acyltransferase [Yoonia litorea]SFS01617.1 hypothetical protein SAMN05444714_0435 [Yoonia litorea]
MLFRALGWVVFRAGQIVRLVLNSAATKLHHARLAQVGRGTRFQRDVSFRNAAQVRIGTGCLICQGVNASSEIGPGHLMIGNGVQINRDVHLDMTGGLSIADDALISEGVLIYTHDHGRDPRSEPRLRPLRVGSGVWIGARAIILPSCHSIGAGALVGAGAVVTSDVPAGAVVVGNPARVVSVESRAA